MLPELKTTTLEAFLNVNPRYRLEMERVMNSEKARLVPALGLSVLTPFYDWVVQRTTREKEFKSALIEQSGIQAGQRVLDLACGTGTLTLSIKGSHPDVNVEGIDGDHSILAIARSKAAASGLDVHFQQALAYALPFTNATFDRVVSSLFFHHLNWLDKQKTVREVIRVLKPDGEFHIADWGRPSNVMMRRQPQGETGETTRGRWIYQRGGNSPLQHSVRNATLDQREKVRSKSVHGTSPHRSRKPTKALHSCFSNVGQSQ
jgi:ubiquinone/menaquinone biosynthesis C-methylase UbiE